jgi:hypothetical protein
MGDAGFQEGCVGSPVAVKQSSEGEERLDPHSEVPP